MLPTALANNAVIKLAIERSRKPTLVHTVLQRWNLVESRQTGFGLALSESRHSKMAGLLLTLLPRIVETIGATHKYAKSW